MNNEAGLFPAVGDIVHFIDDHAAHAPAIVLHIRGDHPRRLWLRVLGIGHADYERHWVEHGDDDARGLAEDAARPAGPERGGEEASVSIRAVSYGGGVQSTALLVLAAERRIDYPLFLFSNVGDDSEHPATLAYVREVAMPYAEQHSVELIELRKRPKGSERTLYQQLTDPEGRSVGIPVRMASGAPAQRHCTTDYKIRRVAAELKRRGASEEQPATVALGISLDEYQRMRTESGIAWERLDYPLIDLRLDRAACVALIERAGLPVPPKSSCFFCPFHSLSVWRQQKRDEPELFAKSVALERRLNEKRAALGKDAVWLTDALRPLDEAVGDHDQLDLFEGPSCDIGGYCLS